MREDLWENLVTLNSHLEPVLDKLPPAHEHLSIRANLANWDESRLPLDVALGRDEYPLPTTANREGYYGPHHFDYWASGLRDYQHLMDCAAKCGVRVGAYLDMGCASGRVLRHIACQSDVQRVFGCDINRRHVDWINRFLPKNIIAFQNHSLPHLNLPDESIDLLSAFSVLTHIEIWDTAWLLEIARVLRPGGIAWITVHSEVTWSAMNPSWPLYGGLAGFPEFKERQGKELPQDVYVFRGRSDRSYSSQVFYKTPYIEDVWGRIMSIREIRRQFPQYQDVVIFQKT